MRQILLVLRYCVAMKGDVCFRLIRLWFSVSKETLHSQCFNRWKKKEGLDSHGLRCLGF